MAIDMRSGRLGRRRFLRQAGAAAGGFAALAGGLAARGVAAQSGGTPRSGGTVTLYNGQHESTTQAMVAAFMKETGIKVEIRSGEDPEIAAQLLAEGDGSPADVVFTENSPPLMLLSGKGMLAPLDAATLAAVPAVHNSPKGEWVGVAARTNVLLYAPALLPESALPLSLLDLAKPEWKGKIAIAPAEGDFLPVVSTVLKINGEDAAKSWAGGLARNAKVYQGNEAILKAVEGGEVVAGAVNHYYWFRMAAEIGADKMTSRLHYFRGGDPGAVVNVSGAAVLASSKQPELAQRLVAFLVGASGQRALVESRDFEYPLGAGAQASPELKPFAELEPPTIGFADLGDGVAAVQLLQDAGLL